MRMSQFNPNTSIAQPIVGYGTGYAQQERTSLEAFIAYVFKQHYNADIAAYCRKLLGIRDGAGQWAAAAGINLADEGPLFLEHYLDSPVEDVISRMVGQPVSREEIAEVGNLAALQAGSTRKLIVKLTETLQANQRPWVCFTATRSLINSFNKLGLSPVIMVAADSSRVPNPAAWGSYYDHQPQVAFGNVVLGYASLVSRDLLHLATEVQ